MRERLKGLETQLKQLKDQEALESELKLVIGRVEEFAAKVTEGLDALDFLGKREIRTLVKRVEVHKDKVKVVFKVGSGPLVSRVQTNLENSSHCCERVRFVYSLRVRQGHEFLNLSPLLIFNSPISLWTSKLMGKRFLTSLLGCQMG